MKRLDVLPARPEMLPQRIGMAALATAAILLPLASVTQFGFTASASLASDSSLAWAMPIAFIAGIALSRNGADENWAKIADLAAAALAVGFLVYSAYSMIEAYTAIYRAEAARDAMMTGLMGGYTPRSRPSMPLMSVAPSFAFLPLIAVAFWSAFSVRSTVAGLFRRPQPMPA
tara:strand:+ start:227 stop:745 length:519 start_codon:yes stop_codon:yes gene_type:complete